MTDGYTVGKGIVTVDGVDVGNAPEFTLTQETTPKIRMRAVNGCRVPMESHIVERKASLKITLDSWTDDVVALAKDGKKACEVIITQTQDIGPKRVWTFSNVDLLPAGELPLISNDWATIDLLGIPLYDETGECMSYEDAA